MKSRRPISRGIDPAQSAPRLVSVGRDRAWPRLIVGIVVVIVVVAWTHWPVLSGQALCLDDGEFLRDNPLVQNPGWESATRFFVEVLEPTTVEGYYLPLSMVSLMADYAMGGRPDDLRMFHRTNLLLHVMNALLVYAVLFALFDNVWAAMLAALLFGLHPLTVEPVAWIGERKTLLAAFFSFLSILAYIGFDHRKARTWLIVSVTAYALALLSKPTAVPLPMLLMALDYWPLRRWNRRALVNKWPYLVLAVAFGVITIISHGRTAGIFETNPSDLVRQPLRLCHLIAFYLGKIVWPIQLSSVYPAPNPMALSNPAVLVGVLVTVLAAVGVVISLKWTRAALAMSAFFLIGMAPTLGVVQYSWVYASDKYVYLPILGILMAIAVALGKLMRSSVSSRVGVIALAAGLCLLEVMGTREYLTKWRDTRTLSEHILTIAPQNAQIRIILASAYEDEGRRDDAIDQYRYAIRIKPDYALAHNNLGTILAMEGSMEEAITHLQMALKIDPDAAAAHSNMATALLDSGRVDEAFDHCRRAIRLKPGYPKPLFVLGNILQARGEIDEAIESYRRAIAAQADYVDALQKLANALQLRGRFAEAITTYRQWLHFAPTSAVGHHNLAIALRSLGDHRAAVEHLREALELNPKYADAQNNLGVSLATLGQTERAIEHFQKAIQINPDYGEAYHNLGLVYQSLGRHGQAAHNYRTALEIEPAGDSQAHFMLGVVLALDHRAREALDAFERALQLEPDNPVVLNSMAWILATNSDATVRHPAEARRLALRAAERTGFRRPEVLDTLAAAYAVNGEFDEAVRTMRMAITLVSTDGAGETESTMKKRLDLYEQKRPYFEGSQ